MKNLYFTESGFTGYNHLDQDQPIFAIASHDLEEDVAEAILRKSFPSYKGEEYKFPNLWKSSKPQLIHPHFSYKIPHFSYICFSQTAYICYNKFKLNNNEKSINNRRE